jgi:hypothetical protein
MSPTLSSFFICCGSDVTHSCICTDITPTGRRSRPSIHTCFLTGTSRKKKNEEMKAWDLKERRMGEWWCETWNKEECRDDHVR